MEPEVVVAITFDDGSVGRMQLFERRRETPTGAVIVEWTDADIQAEINKSAFVSRPVSWRRVTLSDFPTEDHDFRDAWKDDGNVISVDMEKARTITRDRLRVERVPLMKAEDIRWSRALAVDNKAEAAEAEVERQRLRDITALPSIDAAKTPEELRAISILKPAEGQSVARRALSIPPL